MYSLKKWKMSAIGLLLCGLLLATPLSAYADNLKEEAPAIEEVEESVPENGIKEEADDPVAEEPAEEEPDASAVETQEESGDPASEEEPDESAKEVEEDSVPSEPEVTTEKSAPVAPAPAPQAVSGEKASAAQKQKTGGKTAASQQAPTDELVKAPAVTEEPDPDYWGARKRIKEKMPKSGVYTIISGAANDRAVEVKDNLGSNHANIQLGAFTGNTNQEFYLKSLGRNRYTIMAMTSGRYVDAANAGTAVGTNVRQANESGGTSQIWLVTLQEDGTYAITASYCDLVWDLAGGRKDPGTNLRLYTSNASKAQRFKLLQVPNASIADGTYTIATALDSKKVLDVARASAENGANIQIYKSNNTAAQHFRLAQIAGGYYTVVNAASGKAMDVKGGSRANRANVQQYTANGTAAQTWRFAKNSDGTWDIRSASGLALDVAGGRSDNKTNVQLYAANGSKAQKWTLKKYTLPPVEEGVYRIKTALDLKMGLDAQGGTFANGTNVQLYAATNGASASNQQFEVKKVSGEWYTITNLSNGKVLDVKGGRAVNKTNVQLYTSNGSDAQLWKFVLSEDESGYYIVNKNGLCLDVAGARTANRTNIQIYKSNKTKAQCFVLEKSSFNKSGFYARGAKRYYYADGKRVTGWRKIGSKYYYFNSKGVMQVSKKVYGRQLDANGVAGKNVFIESIKPGGKTLKNLLQNSLVPNGRVLYIWGGGWGTSDSRKIGYLDSWGSFFSTHATPTYRRQNYEYAEGYGLDCSGYVGWVTYNTMNTKNGKTDILANRYNSTQLADRLTSLGWATTKAKPSSYSALKAGDICSMYGHVYICLGSCADGSAVIIHSSGIGKTYGGGVQLSGTPDRNGKKDSEGYRLAKQYMENYFIEWPYGVESVGKTYLSNMKNYCSWKNDPDGLRNKSAKEVLKVIFNE